MDVYVRNQYNMPIGFTRDNGAEVQAFHLTKGFVGFYVKGSDITFKASGGIYSYGNACTDLIREAERNK